MEVSDIKFIRKKNYKLVRNIGQGGTGKTVLLEDEIINELFVCKKYSPANEEYKELYFPNFVNEIKIMHKIFHNNVVRIYNYHLYPEYKTGFIIMEYIKGDNISTYLKNNPDKLNDVFIQTINGFKYLESKNIIHRDIRPDNLLVDKNNSVKIIDFGFGKEIEFEKTNNKSISLNWRYKEPQDFEEKIYDFRTEVYFVGKLFKEIIEENGYGSFGYNDLLERMIETNMNQRIESFFKVESEILSCNNDLFEFTPEHIQIYRNFANNLSRIFISIYHNNDYNSDIDDVIKKLESVYRFSMLEEYVQDSSIVCSVFYKGGYTYSQNTTFPVYSVKDFMDMLKSLEIEKRKIVINNLWTRLVPKIEGEKPNKISDDLPF